MFSSMYQLLMFKNDIHCLLLCFHAQLRFSQFFVDNFRNIRANIRENIYCDVMPYGPNEVRPVQHDVTTNIFRMDQTQG